MPTLPDGFTIRPATMDDLQTAVDITNERARADIGEGDMTVARMHTFWIEPERNMKTDNWLISAPDGRPAAYSDFSTYDAGASLEFDYAVLPEFEGIGLEQAIYDVAIDRAQQESARVPADNRVILETGVWASNTRDRALLEAADFHQTRVWNRMLIDMCEMPPEPAWPTGISVRTFEPAELAQVHEAWEDAQRDEYGFSSLTPDEFRHYFLDQEPDFDPTLWFLAIDDATGTIAGYVLGRWERPGEPESGHIRYVAVRRQYRRRGIAHALLLHAFREYFRRGKSRVGLAVDSTSLTGADRLYERAGMHPTSQLVFYTRVIREPLPTD